MNDRLSKSDWIKHGLRTLAEDGPGGLKVGPMAAGLKVSRGSFYWHFADIADFRSQLLRSWQARGTDQVIQQIGELAEPDRLRSLLARAFDIRPDLDRAMRSWAAHEAEVAAVVASADAARVGYIARLIVAAGVDPRRAQGRATFLYWAFLGRATVMDPRHAALAAEDMDDISALFEGPAGR